ncbi:MAG: hypothetical protein JXC36_09720 [Candidatus Atribacteria bacterium]|nr:hypothetical protein [Candidatus Atribacteria bacterium]
MALNDKSETNRKLATDNICSAIQLECKSKEQLLKRLLNYAKRNNDKGKITKSILASCVNKPNSLGGYCSSALKTIILINDDWSRNLIKDYLSNSDISRYMKTEIIECILTNFGAKSGYSLNLTHEDLKSINDYDWYHIYAKAKDPEDNLVKMIEDYLFERSSKCKEFDNLFVSALVENKRLRIVPYLIEEGLKSSEGVIREFYVPKKLFKDYASILKRLFWIDKTSEKTEGRGSIYYEKYKYDTSDSTQALKELCEIKSDFSSFILNIVKDRKPIEKTAWREQITDDWVDWRYTKISFAEQQKIAVTELEKRNNPIPNIEDLKLSDFEL